MTDNTLLLQLMDMSAWDVHDMGFEWYRSQLLPALTNPPKEESITHEVLHHGWILVADIQVINDAPKKAIYYYKKALEFDDSSFETCLALALMLNQIGQFSEAFMWIEKAIELDPKNEELHKERHLIQDNLNYDHTPVLTEGDIIWKLAEQMANGEFEEIALHYLLSEDPEVLRYRAQAFGALNAPDQCKAILNKIKILHPDFVFSDADRFYIPEDFH